MPSLLFGDTGKLCLQNKKCALTAPAIDIWKKLCINIDDSVGVDVL